MHKVSAKYRRFVAEYMIDQNATQAAIRAGYSKKTADVQGPRLLGIVWIREAIDKMLKKHEISAERIIAELAKLATSDVRDIYKEDGSLKPISEWPASIARCVSAVEQEEIYEYNNGRRENVGDVRKVKLWDKTRALEILARYHKLLTDKVEHSGSLTLEQIVAGIKADAA